MGFVEVVAAPMFTEELSELVSCTGESLTVCVCLWAGLGKMCVCLLQREREREAKGREGRRDKEKREKGCYSSLTLAKVSLSLRCLMTLFGFCSGAPACSDQLHSSPPHRRTVDSIARLPRLFVLLPNACLSELFVRPHSGWGKCTVCLPGWWLHFVWHILQYLTHTFVKTLWSLSFFLGLVI